MRLNGSKLIGTTPSPRTHAPRMNHAECHDIVEQNRSDVEQLIATLSAKLQGEAKRLFSRECLETLTTTVEPLAAIRGLRGDEVISESAQEWLFHHEKINGVTRLSILFEHLTGKQKHEFDDLMRRFADWRHLNYTQDSGERNNTFCKKESA